MGVYLSMFFVLCLFSDESEKSLLVEKLRRITDAYHNTRFSVTHTVAGNKRYLEEFEIVLAASRNDYDLVVKSEGISDDEFSQLVSEVHCRRGVSVSCGDFTKQEHNPPFYRGAWVFDCQRQQDWGLDLAFGLLNFGSDSGIDLTDPEVLSSGMVKSNEHGKHLRLEQGNVVARLYFLGPGNALSRVDFDFDGEVDRFSGKYADDGRAIYDKVPDQRKFYFSKIVMQEDQIREMQLNYLSDKGWIETTKIVVGAVEKLENELEEGYRFTAVRKPEFSVVAFDDEFGRYVLNDGQLVQVFDATAYRVLSDLLGRELELPQDRKVPFHLQDYLRKFPSNHCGVYSVLTAAAALQCEPQLDNLFSPQQIKQTSGSSAADLVSFLQEHGLQAKVYSGASADFLKKVAANGDVAILHFRHSYKQEGEHWATFLGMTDEKARIVDLPRSPEDVAIPDLMTDWDGIVIVASKRPVEGYAVASFYQNTAVWVVSALVILGVVQLVVSRLRRRRGWHSTAAMLAAVAVTAVLFEAMNPHGLYANPEVTGVVIGRYFQYVPETIQRAEFPENAVFVDARTPEDFRRKHIPGAVNLPVDFSVGELRAFTQQHTDRDQPIVVYCAHAQCGWASNLSRRLVALGYNDIKVYEPGLVGYYTEETL